jgi:hypothetical protein
MFMINVLHNTSKLLRPFILGLKWRQNLSIDFIFAKGKPSRNFVSSTSSTVLKYPLTHFNEVPAGVKEASAALENNDASNLDNTPYSKIETGRTFEL